jgi:hypothetical protein
MPLVTVSAVHENVHERTGEEEQVGQCAEEVNGVLGDQVEAADGNDQGQRSAGG